jgi:hypothetical protein
MVSQISAPEQTEVIYPDCDGKPVANNTIQFRWLVEIQQNLDYLFNEDGLDLISEIKDFVSPR